MAIEAHNDEEKTLSNAIDTFHKFEKGILDIINAADIYCVHVIAKYRNWQDVRVRSTFLPFTYFFFIMPFR